MGTLHGLSLMERFMSKVDQDSDSSCWQWLGGTQSSGYGAFAAHASKRRPTDPADVGWWLAHRFAYERIGGGVLDPTLTIDHLCENKLCVNPGHLEQVTREENTRRQRASERVAS